jgi:ankyrin repeat protein
VFSVFSAIGMDSDFLRLKQAVISNDVALFDSTASAIVDSAQLNHTHVHYAQTDSAGYTLLHWACHLVKPVFVKKLLEFGVPATCRDSVGKTALQRGMERTTMDPSTLMSAFAPYLTAELLGLSDRAGRTVLHVACMKGYEDSVRTILEHGGDVNQGDSRGWTPLHFACFYDRPALVKLLLMWSYSPQTPHAAKKTESTSHTSLVKCNLSAESRDGWTPLHAAASQGHDEIVAELLSHGADPNRRAFKNGQTALHVACLNSQSGCVKLLCENDADAKIADKSGLNSMACAPKEIRAVLRKTKSNIETEPSNTSIVGMPHHPTAEREAKFAIQARDKWNRRRTQGGDLYSVSITLSSSSGPTQTTTPESPSQIVSLIASSPAVRLSGEQLSGSRGSLDENLQDSILPSSRQTSSVHTGEEPRNMLKAAQASSTPSVISTPPRTRVTGGSQNQIDREPSKSTVGTSATTDDTLGPRAHTDVARTRAMTELHAPNVGIQNTANGHSSMITKDLESGLYILKWRPSVEGTYRISIQLRGCDIHGSPFLVTIAPSRARVPTDLRRIVNSSLAGPSSVGRTYSGLSASDEDSISRAHSSPVDLISNLRPDMTPKPNVTPNAQSAPALKKDKKSKASKSGNSSGIIVTGSALTPHPPNLNATTAEATSRKRSSSAASKATAPDLQSPGRDRAGTVAPSQVTPSDPLKTSGKSTLLQGPQTPGDEVIPSANSSSVRDRPLYRVTSTFSPLKPLGSEVPSIQDPEQLAQEVKMLEANLSETTRQLQAFSLRIQELETDQIISTRKHEETRVEDRAKMTKLATALRAEREARLCKACKAVSKNAIAVPCLHMSHCSACIEVLDKCPVCSGLLKGFITAQLSDHTTLDTTTPR